MKEELERAWKEAYSIKGTPTGMRTVGIQEKENELWYFYQDQEGKYWYETKFRRDGKIISETEHVFGKIPESIKQEEKRRRDIAWGKMLKKCGMTG